AVVARIYHERVVGQPESVECVKQPFEIIVERGAETVVRRSRPPERRLVEVFSIEVVPEFVENWMIVVVGVPDWKIDVFPWILFVVLGAGDQREVWQDVVHP